MRGRQPFDNFNVLRADSFTLSTFDAVIGSHFRFGKKVIGSVARVPGIKRDGIVVDGEDARDIHTAWAGQAVFALGAGDWL